MTGTINLILKFGDWAKTPSVLASDRFILGVIPLWFGVLNQKQTATHLRD